MALDKSTLEIRLRIAFAKSGTNPSPSSQTALAQDLADAIFQYLIGATVSTTVTGTAVGGVNASIPPPSGPTPGPITVPATVTGSGTGTLS